MPVPSPDLPPAPSGLAARCQIEHQLHAVLLPLLPRLWRHLDSPVHCLCCLCALVHRQREALKLVRVLGFAWRQGQVECVCVYVCVCVCVCLHALKHICLGKYLCICVCVCVHVCVCTLGFQCLTCVPLLPPLRALDVIP